ncbi:hypothetical protein K1T71_014991 [Dendrolimus kikuchii]|nr:hypothetical protein K1T71_014991 [Dendrolimus kikuchii]
MSKIPPGPPDLPPGSATCNEQMDQEPCGSRSRPAEMRKRPAVDEVSNIPSKKAPLSSDLNTDKSLWVHHSLNVPYKYSSEDKGPFLVHVHRIENNPSSGATINKILFGKMMINTNVGKIVQQGIKSVGRNRISVEFLSAQDANNFVVNPTLTAAHYKAIIPTFNVSRMGVVQGVPKDWSMEEFVEQVELPDYCGQIIKARRFSRKVRQPDGSIDWTPTTTVVLTFTGQILPKHIYCCYTSIPVTAYQLPTIQCFTCCRFGHVSDKCRSKPRCYKCGQLHSGNTCSVAPENAFCCLCKGCHYAIDKNCPELERQKLIKKKMSEDNISYSEAATLFPPSVRSFSDWNTRNVKNKKHEINYLLNNYKPIIFAISETWLKPNTIFRVPGYSCLRDDRDDGWAGTAFLISRQTIFSQIPLPPHSPELNIVAVQILSLKITFVSVYIPHPNSNIIQELSSILSPLPTPLIVQGDFNIRHTLWGSPVCDSVSHIFLDLLDNLNLCVINDGTPTRRVSPTQNVSVPDLTLCSPSLTSILTWTVLPYSYGSDHLPILTTLVDSSLPVSSLPPILKYRLNLADWDRFSYIVQDKLSSLPPTCSENILHIYSEFTTILISAAEEAIPLKNSARDKIPSPAWWDAECSDKVRKRKEAESNFNKSPSLENFLHFQKISAHTKRFLSKKKQLGWRSFCESLTPRTPASIIWKRIKAFRKSQVDPNISSNNPAWLLEFVNKLAPPYVPSELPIPSPVSSRYTDKMNNDFTYNELCGALDHLRDSSPGIDSIPYSFITKSTEPIKLFFLKLINIIFETGYIPHSWKTQIIIPILKPGKDPLDPNSYRPIALSSVLAKIMEMLIKNRLEWIVENQGILPHSQFGFRRGLGTLDSLSLLVTDIRTAFSRNEHVIGVFLDISSAYDNVNLSILRHKMLQLSIPEKIVNFIYSLFSERSIVVRSCGTYLPPRLVWKGLPQGSVLSPILYNVYTASLDTSVNCFCKILQYADDIALYAISDSFPDACSRVNSALFYLNGWLTEHGLSLSPAKSSAMIFTRKRVTPILDINVNNNPIKVEDKVKFLGIHLDPKLSGITHLNFVCEKIEKNINVIRALSGIKWGSHPYCQKLLYNAIVRSHIDYGSFLMEPCNKLSLAKLNRLQAKCLRLITGAMKSSPTNALQVECLEPPLALRSQFLADRFFFRVTELSHHPLLISLSDLHELVTTSPYWNHKTYPPLIKSYQKSLNLSTGIYQNYRNPLFQTEFDDLLFRPKIIFNFGVEKNSIGANQIFNRILYKNWQGWLPIFTDASKLTLDSHVGAAVWIPEFRIILNYKIPPHSSVFTGEAIAILEAIQYIKSHHLSKCLILTDSLSCLQDLSKLPFRTKENFSLTLKIKSSLKTCHDLGLEIVLAWIPGHAGISGNETADNCAKQAVHIGCDKYSKCFSRDLRLTAKNDMFNSWNDTWQQSRQTTGRLYVNPNFAHLAYLPTTKLLKKFCIVNYRQANSFKRIRTTPLQP